MGILDTLRDRAPFLKNADEKQRSDSLMKALPGTDSPTDVLRLLRTPFEYLLDQYENYGPISRTRLVTPMVWVLGNEELRTMLIQKRSAFSWERGYKSISFGQLFDRSIVTMDGEQAAYMRDVLTPAISRLGIRESNLKVQEVWSEATAALDDGTSYDAYDFVHHTTFRVSAQALVGMELGPELDEMFPLFEAMIDGAIQSVPYPIPFTPLAKGIRARHELFDRLRPRIKDVRARGDETGMVGLLANHKDADGNYMDYDEVAEHLLVLFWAGYDTTASAGSWCLHLLAHNPIWQDRLREEALRVLGDRDFELGDVANLEQLSWFLREQERHCPSILMFTRQTFHEVELGGYTLPAGASVLYSPYVIHHNPKLWERPNIFDPGRWDPALGERQAKAANLFGFGGGPRLCIGRNFALMQLRVLITTVLRDYYIEPDMRFTPTRMGIPMHRPIDSRLFFRRVKR